MIRTSEFKLCPVCQNVHWVRTGRTDELTQPDRCAEKGQKTPKKRDKGSQSRHYKKH